MTATPAAGPLHGTVPSGRGRGARKPRRRGCGGGRPAGRGASGPRGCRRGACALQSSGSCARRIGCDGPTSTLLPIRPVRWATRWWWLSTGSAGMRSTLNERTAALVFGPMPGIASSQALASATGRSARKSRERPPRRSRDPAQDRLDARRLLLRPGHAGDGLLDLGDGGVDERAQSGYRARSALKARPESALRVRCESSEETSSLTGSRLWKYGIGQP